uniref:Uncharacterized protein n=1 Tax=Anguilla anguilla TaxID=7936 RepID=A0A0E9QE93_ANGAN
MTSFTDRTARTVHGEARLTGREADLVAHPQELAEVDLLLAGDKPISFIL